jgi:hypothetical protein
MTTFRFVYAITAISLERPISVAEMNLRSGRCHFRNEWQRGLPMFLAIPKVGTDAFAAANDLLRNMGPMNFRHGQQP